MSDEKTLGQVYIDGMRSVKPGSGLKEVSAAGIAAVCRAVMAEVRPGDKVRLGDREGVVLAADEATGKIQSVAFDMNKQAKPEAASEAGDWAYSTIAEWHVIRDAVPTIPTSELKALAEDLREAAARHYGEKIVDLQMKLIESNNKLLEKIGTPSQLEHAKRLADRLDAATLAEAKVPAPYEALVKDYRAVRKERDAAVEKTATAKYALSFEKEANQKAKQRAEAAESDRDKIAAELVEVKAACQWVDENSIWLGNTGRARWACGQQYGNELLNVILAAFRTTKGKEQGDGRK